RRRDLVQKRQHLAGDDIDEQQKRALPLRQQPHRDVVIRLIERREKRDRDERKRERRSEQSRSSRCRATVQEPPFIGSEYTGGAFMIRLDPMTTRRFCLVLVKP